MNIVTPRHDLTGKKFTRLTVIRQALLEDKEAVWKCRCECGTVKEVRGSALTAGLVKSCGCLRAEYLATRKGSTRGLKLSGNGMALTKDGRVVSHLRYIGDVGASDLEGNVDGYGVVRWGRMGKTLRRWPNLDLDKQTV